VPDGVVEGDEIVLAAGAHSGAMARELGARVRVDAGKGYSLHYEPAPLSVGRALYLYESRVAVTPFNDSLRLAGTMEFSGLNTSLRPRRVAAIGAAARRYLQGWPAGIEGRPWAGMRPMTPDGLPVIGRIADNVSIASGHAMLGVTLGPATGEAIADLLTTGKDAAVRLFDPTRFSRRRAGARPRRPTPGIFSSRDGNSG
jgi:D-amino-acid dehydrogenase